jgi:hypothetical protein
MAIRGGRFAAVACAVLFVVPVAEGQNLVFNPDFDVDVAGWTALSEATLAWDPLDSSGSSTSGSAVVSNLAASAGSGTGVLQCIEGLQGGLTYLFDADILVPGGQSNTGQAYLLVQWYDQPGCNLGFLGLILGSAVTTGMTDAWYRVADFGVAPAGTAAARVRLDVLKVQASGSLDAHFDAVGFEEVLYYDGFESSDTNAWSAVVGLPPLTD